jgi:hypothetical protein
MFKDLNRNSRSLFVFAFLLDVEILDLIWSLVCGNDVQEFSETVLLEVLLGQVLQVSLWEWDAGWDGDFCGIWGNGDLVSQVSNLILDFDSCSQEFGEVGGVENLILNWLWAVNGEAVADFLLLGDFFTHG